MFEKQLYQLNENLNELGIYKEITNNERTCFEDECKNSILLKQHIVYQPNDFYDRELYNSVNTTRNWIVLFRVYE